ncbi:hypothetical protein TVAG_191060 [Trichomonas vaginalis G3]|uniref:Uncharacterized protein n=1 Tax=Trichomonas vaginalis (strain ATCC PRA-98 / G3) TaxID=412133 RepID=A2EFI9_TRIV3|nr:hypothetical protein TVAGG3_0820940 [Trichomonas vaginalis G3]EAY08583.1 hypothetical protein TVAG_191060 [Trichomonas vaginalis G3]KAI5497884.1 hypothetical protein TVAGG3_0820940 [Trichomonas vaginalis G3]|eukprot:XP_001320806.1 hypothetical protein [Trichomonas vaginalis G3]
MENTNEADFDQVPQTSPVHKPAFDYDFDIAMALQSPLSAPLYSPNNSPFGPFDKLEDTIPTYSFADFGVPVPTTTLQQELEKKMEKPVTPKKNLMKKKIQFVYRPFVSLEASELTVHQLRSLLSKPPRKANQSKAASYSCI